MHEVQRIEHVAIAVHDAAEAVEHFRALGFALGPVEEVEGGIRSHILESAGASIEILESTHPTSTLSRYLERVGEGLHHLCLRVSSLEDAVDSAEAAGCTLVDSEPTVDSVGWRVFVHPRSNYGVLMGLVEPHEREKARVIDPAGPSSTA